MPQIICLDAQDLLYMETNAAQNNTASSGCPVFGSGIRNQIANSGDNELRVTQVGSVITLECMTNIEQLENEEYVISAECYDPLGVVITGAFSNAFANSFDN